MSFFNDASVAVSDGMGPQASGAHCGSTIGSDNLTASTEGRGCDAEATAMPQPHADFKENPIAYFLLIDRFSPPAQGHDAEVGKDPYHDLATFHGGTLKAVTDKICTGWFNALGVNVLWLSAPFEQIPGWVPGGDGQFRHFAYHGYFTHDYTRLDSRFGTEDDLRELVDQAHLRGLRVILDVVINHPGYLDLATMATYMPAVLADGWQHATPDDFHRYVDYDSAAFRDWWGPDWVRAGLPGYTAGGTDDLTMQLAGLPDFCTENSAVASLPQFLRAKPDTRAVELPGATVRDYLTEWLSWWVREFGIDGFRCDSAKHVELETWSVLKQKASGALAEWKTKNPHKKIDDSPFWMTGEVFGHWIERSAYFDHGFDNLINFGFQHELDGMDLDSLFHRYAARLSGRPGYNVLSYISSHDTHLFDRGRLREAATDLLLVPGGVQIFYGDETARPPASAPDGDPVQSTRSAMNWANPDKALTAHWRILGQFRSRHLALARGEHTTWQQEPYVFSRHDRVTDDKVIVGMDLWGEHRIQAECVFDEGEQLIDAYTGRRVRNANGSIHVDGCGLVLIERLCDHRAPFHPEIS